MASSVGTELSAKLIPTLCPNQKRFFCGEHEIVLWRSALLLRYSSFQGGSFSFKSQDFDKDNTVIESVIVPSFETPNVTPPELAKTVLRFKVQNKKFLTITLYFTVTPAGTLLCQGRGCAMWSAECDLVEKLLAKYNDNNDHVELTESLCNLPLSFRSTMEDKCPMNFYPSSRCLPQTHRHRSSFLCLRHPHPHPHPLASRQRCNHHRPRHAAQHSV